MFLANNKANVRQLMSNQHAYIQWLGYTVVVFSAGYYILQLWGMCSRNSSPRSTPDEDDTSSLPEAVATAVDTLMRDAPHPRARGLENRIITGIRNHRQKAVQSFLQHYRETKATPEPGICPRYLKFSQTAACFARALAEGDARAVQQHSLGSEVETQEEEDWDIMYY
jgi:hypothetical protein